MQERLFIVLACVSDMNSSCTAMEGFNTWTPTQWIDCEEMSFCQWAPFHERDGLRDEWQIASVSPLFSLRLLGTFVLCVACFGGVFVVACVVFSSTRFLAIIASLSFTVQEIR